MDVRNAGDARLGQNRRIGRNSGMDGGLILSNSKLEGSLQRGAYTSAEQHIARDIWATHVGVGVRCRDATC